MHFAPSSMPPSQDPDGILLVDKPAGITSSTIVVSVRRMFNLKKVGHGGTLDPGATGLLVLLIGRGTRAQDQVMGGDKVYQGSLRLGRETNTQDWEGETVAEADPSAVTEEQLRAVIQKEFIGDVLQTPPMVSAIKLNGEPLYKLARRGEEVERKPRLIHVYRFSLDSFENPNATFTVSCTKGTYIRTLCHDIGELLGCHAHMTSLRRLACGKFSLENAISFEDLKLLPRADLHTKILPLSVLGDASLLTN